MLVSGKLMRTISAHVHPYRPVQASSKFFQHPAVRKIGKRALAGGSCGAARRMHACKRRQRPAARRPGRCPNGLKRVCALLYSESLTRQNRTVRSNSKQPCLAGSPRLSSSARPRPSALTGCLTDQGRCSPRHLGRGGYDANLWRVAWSMRLRRGSAQPRAPRDARPAHSRSGATYSSRLTRAAGLSAPPRPASCAWQPPPADSRPPGRP
jgi:hypothetical protein